MTIVWHFLLGQINKNPTCKILLPMTNQLLFQAQSRTGRAFVIFISCQGLLKIFYLVSSGETGGEGRRGGRWWRMLIAVRAESSLLVLQSVSSQPSAEPGQWGSPPLHWSSWSWQSSWSTRQPLSQPDGTPGEPAPENRKDKKFLISSSHSSLSPGSPEWKSF